MSCRDTDHEPLTRASRMSESLYLAFHISILSILKSDIFPCKAYPIAPVLNHIRTSICLAAKVAMPCPSTNSILILDDDKIRH